MAERTSNIWFTKDIPYLTVTGESRGIFYEDCGENWHRYNRTALYLNVNSIVTGILQWKEGVKLRLPLLKGIQILTIPCSEYEASNGNYFANKNVRLIS